MATKSSNGGPAFPVVNGINDHELQESSFGMTLRQWYKGMALLAMHGGSENEVLAKRCGLIADAMLDEDAEFERGAK